MQGRRKKEKYCKPYDKVRTANKGQSVVSDRRRKKKKRPFDRFISTREKKINKYFITLSF